MDDAWFLSCLERAIKKGMVVFMVSQCSGGEVIMGRYDSSRRLEKIGVIGGRDITTEAAVAKLMLLLAEEPDKLKLIKKLKKPMIGEMDF